jgi:hypothetical protein
MGVRSIARGAVRKLVFDQRNARFHFIHIPKNAGQSVRRALSLQRDVSLGEPYHARYVDVADELGRHLRYFAVVRNPWSRTASRYHFGKQNARKWPVDDPRRRFIERATFADFVKEQRLLPIPEHPGQPWMGPLSSWFNQLDWIRDERGAVACECLRMERLEDDLRAFLGRRISLRRRNVTKNQYDYRAMYSDELAEIVADTFREDIGHFGFTFEGPATRNVVGGDG